MSQFVETIRIENQKILNLKWHNSRFNNTIKQFYPESTIVDLSTFIKVPKTLDAQVIKCRILYTDKIEDIQYSEYQKKKINSLRIVNADHISYDYKFTKRSEIDDLYQKKGSADDILMIKNRMVTDAYYYNVALYDGDIWFTPHQALLSGTQRANLLDRKIIKELVISKADIKYFKQIALFNAMIPWNEKIVINTENILD